MNDVPDDCICRRLLDLGVAEALEHAAHRDEMFIAIQACLDKGLCAEREQAATAQQAPSPAASKTFRIVSRRKQPDRRSGEERRQIENAPPPERERRVGGERRSGGDRRGLLADEQYTPQQAILNLRAWCNGHCKSPFELQLDTKTGELRFRFDSPADRDDFKQMLQKFKGFPGSQN